MLGFFKFRNFSEWLEESKETVIKTKPKVWVVGAGVIGIASAYYLSKFGDYEVTVIEKDTPVRGASEQNANTITISSLPVFNSMNFMKILKENLMFKEKPSSYVKFTLIFESQFRLWLRHYLKSRSKEQIEKSTNAVITLSYLGCSLYDDYMMDLTNSNPDIVDYHQEFFTKIYKNQSETDIASKRKLMGMIAKYDPGCHELSAERLEKFPGANFGFEVTTRMLNTDTFWAYARTKLAEKYGVNFIEGTVNQATYSDRKIHSIGYLDKNKHQQILGNFDEYVFWGGVESAKLGNLVGLRVPIYGIQGYSLNTYVDKENMPDSSYMFIPENVVACRIGLNTSGMIRFTGHGDLVGNTPSVLEFRKKSMNSNDFLLNFDNIIQNVCEWEV